MAKKWVFPLSVLLIPISCIIVLAAFLEIEIAWATWAITVTGMYLFFDAAAHVAHDNPKLVERRRNLTLSSNRNLLFFFGLLIAVVILDYAFGLARDENITTVSVIFVSFVLFVYVLAYVLFLRHFLRNDSLAEEVGSNSN